MYYCISRWIRKFDYHKAVSVLVTTLLIFQIIGVVFLFVPLLKQVKASGSIEQTATGTWGQLTTNPVTVSFDCNSGDLLVVGIYTYYYTRPGTPTYNGVNMIASPEGQVGFDQANESNVEMWYLVSPASGSNTISIPNDGPYEPGSNEMTLIASAWSGVDTADPLDTSESDKNTGSANPSVTFTTGATNELIIDAMMSGNPSVPTANSHTPIGSVDIGGWNANAQYTLDDGSSGITLDWTVTSDDWAMIVCAFNPAGAPQNNGSPQNNDPTQDPNILPQTGADLY